MVNLSTVRCSGPLLDHFEELGRELLALGYTPLSANNVLRVAAHLSRWLESHRLSLEDLTHEHIAAFFRARRRARYTQFLTPNALQPVLRYLVSTGTTTRLELIATPAGPLEQLLCDYAHYLPDRARTDIRRCSPVSRFCAVFFGDSLRNRLTATRRTESRGCHSLRVAPVTPLQHR